MLAHRIPEFFGKLQRPLFVRMRCYDKKFFSSKSSYKISFPAALLH